MAERVMGEFGEDLDGIRDDLRSAEREFSRRIVGNLDTLRFMMKALLSGGHVLLEGVPGTGKTLMVRTMAGILDLKYTRIQFTPDLMPADIVGTNIIVEDERGRRHFRFEKGPVFTHILLADEINRASPKTQSALLQAMEEKEATVFGRTHSLDEVFFTLATQNPIEMAGTYPLPEAQLDRFFFKLDVGFPDIASLREIGRLNAETAAGHLDVARILSRERILSMRGVLNRIPITDRIYGFASRLIHMTHPENPDAPDQVKRFVRYGASPRGLNTILSAARVSAVMAGRVNLALEDIQENYLPSLRHRILLRFESQVEKIEPDVILMDVFKRLKPGY